MKSGVKSGDLAKLGEKRNINFNFLRHIQINFKIQINLVENFKMSIFLQVFSSSYDVITNMSSVGGCSSGASGNVCFFGLVLRKFNEKFKFALSPHSFVTPDLLSELLASA